MGARKTDEPSENQGIVILGDEDDEGYVDDNSEEMDTEDISIVRALGGSVDAITLLRAHVLETGGEHRPQQEEMVEAVAGAIERNAPLFVQAGTGTGKSLAYSFAVAAANKRAIIATATNQLSEQLVRHDLPEVAETLRDSGLDFTFSMLKGRSNYACLARVSELRSLDAQAPGAPEQDRLFDLPEDDAAALKATARAKDSTELTDLLDWVQDTESGDRNEGPQVSDRVWNQVSVSNADCVGSNCSFYTECFTELARKKAKTVNVVVTNHALLSQDVKQAIDSLDQGNAGVIPSVFGPHEVVVVDEAHAFADALTSALSRDLNPQEIDKFLRKGSVYLTTDARNDKGDSVTVTAARHTLELLTEELISIPNGPLLEIPDYLQDILISLTTQMMRIQVLLSEASSAALKANKPKRSVAISLMNDQITELIASVAVAKNVAETQVRWVAKDRDGLKPVLKIAPIHVGDVFAGALEARTFIGTSATLTSGKRFDSIVHSLGLDGAATVDVGTPFHYPKQGMLYIPRAPFPEPVGRERTEHTAAVLKTTEDIVRAAGGRTLALFTTTAGAQRAAEHLRLRLPKLNILAHGDAPADILVREFREDETSVLCATMGLWHGVDVQGASCSVVIIDKVAFSPMDDVLTAARRAYVDEQGRDGFTEVIVAQAATSLAQGVGRLIRSSGDKGIVAILDPRIMTKNYGRTLLASLPNFPLFHDEEVVLAALTRLTGGYDMLPAKSKMKTSNIGKVAGSAGRPKAPRAKGSAAAGTRKIPSRSRKRTF